MWEIVGNITVCIVCFGTNGEDRTEWNNLVLFALVPTGEYWKDWFGVVSFGANSGWLDRTTGDFSFVGNKGGWNGTDGAVDFVTNRR